MRTHRRRIMDGVMPGQTIVMVYSEAMALTLEKKMAAAQ